MIIPKTPGVQIRKRGNSVELIKIEKHIDWQNFGLYKVYFGATDKWQRPNTGRLHHYSLESATRRIKDLPLNNIIKHNAIKEVTRIFEVFKAEKMLEEFKERQVQELKSFKESLAL